MAHHHDCECGHDHHHEHEHESNSVQIDRYHEAFNKFESALPDTQTTEAVNALLEKHFQENFTPEVLKTIHGCIDLTSLTSLDTKESIWKMVDTVNDFEGTRPDVPNVAAICVYPLFVETVKQALTAQEIKIASVAGGFPSSQTFTEVKIAETAMAVMQGADEIDVVMNLGYFMEDNFEELTEELQEIKESCRHAHLKVILETGALVTTENIQKASILAMYSGADFIKTSTGKGYPGATFEAAYTMCKAIKTYHSITGNKVGIKISGGVRTAEDAVRYYTIVKEILGNEWLNKGARFTVTDVRTGKSFRARRFGGWYHADSEPITKEDTAVMKSLEGFSWNRRPIWVTYNGKTVAASMHTMPHMANPTKSNGFDGHFCIHLLNSKVHANSKACPRHQACVQEAYRAGKAK